MKTISARFAPAILIFILSASCASLKTNCGTSYAPPYPTNELDSVVYLAGDAGIETPVLFRLREHLVREGKLSAPIAVVFLGDNIYPSGMSGERRDARRLQQQIDTVNDLRVQTFFVPGNHDWASGAQGVKAQARYIAERNTEETSVNYLPAPQCAGPELRELGSRAKLLFIDSQVLLGVKQDQEPACTTSTQQFYDVLAREARSERVVLAFAHHPIESGGPHGGAVSLSDPASWRNLLRFDGWRSDQDLQSRPYRIMRNAVHQALRGSDAIWITGHEHSFQLLERDQTFIVTGAAAKRTPLRRLPGMRLCATTRGFTRLQIPKEGPLHLTYIGEDGNEIFSTLIARPKTLTPR